MDNRNRNTWYSCMPRSQSGLKGRPPPRLAPPPEPPSPHDDLINYIHEAWEKVARDGAARVWEPSCTATSLVRPPLAPLDIDSWLRLQSKHAS